MTARIKPEGIREPKNLDMEKAQAIVLQIIQANKAWVKEMADK